MSLSFMVLVSDTVLHRISKKKISFFEHCLLFNKMIMIVVLYIILNTQMSENLPSQQLHPVEIMYLEERFIW